MAVPDRAMHLAATIRRVSAALRHAWRRSGHGWTNELDAVISDLEELNRSTETDFLALTGKLAEVSSAAETISSHGCAMLECIAGARGKRVREALLAVLETCADAKASAEAADKLARMSDSLGCIRRSFVHFRRVGPAFYVMATLARLETGRLGLAGLDVSHLADEFRSAGADILGQADSIIETVMALEKRIDATLGRVSAFDSEALMQVRPLVAAAQGALQQFGARQEQSSAAAGRIAMQAQEFASSIADLITLVQVHDITRQQVEHVIESLRQLGGEAHGVGFFRRTPPGAASVIELQLAQLTNAGNGFADGLRQIDQRLVAIVGQVNAMAVESSSLFGSSGVSDGAFYSKMEICFRGIAGAVARCGEIKRAAGADLLELHRSFETLRNSTGQIHHVELRLRRLAVNGAVGAAHLGVAGEALEAVAGAMARLLSECEVSSADADAKIGAAIVAIRAAGKCENFGGAPGVALSDRLQDEIEELRNVNDATTKKTRDIVQIASGLSGDVDALRDALTAQELFASIAGRSCLALRRLKAAIASEEARPDANALVELKRRYTMREERDIHESVLTPLPPAAAPAAPAGSSPTAEFGDNVELF